MANTTFSGPVRSQNGFQTISVNSTTGAVTVTGSFGFAMGTPAATGAGIEGTAAVYETSVLALQTPRVSASPPVRGLFMKPPSPVTTAS